jgi:hypothetical protein
MAAVCISSIFDPDCGMIDTETLMHLMLSPFVKLLLILS